MEARRKKILEEVLPLRLIREVEKWPVLYARDCPEASNSHFRAKVWQEVAKNLIEGWDSLSRPDRESKATDCSKKWRHLYDTFKRRYKYQRKEYVYAKYMSFLKPHLADTDAVAPAPAAGGTRELARRLTARRPAAAERGPPAAAIEHIDEDEHFLMSLLPSFRKMSDDEKLTAKMEILRVIKEVRGGSGGGLPAAGDATDALRLVGEGAARAGWETSVKVESERLVTSDTHLLCE